MIRLACVILYLLVAASARAQPSASKGTAPADSVRVKEAKDSGPILPPWAAHAALGERNMEALRAKGADDLFEALPGASLRVAGDRGFPAYLDLSPVDGGSVEILEDGIPTHSPGDLDPGLWDISATGLGYVDRRASEGAQALGGSAMLLERDPAVWGRTLARTHFHKAAHESYLRGISLTTPRAPKMLRLDYEEWKTDLGYQFSIDPNLRLSSGFGRSKMRRFMLSTQIETELGRWSFGFGRGRRYYDGSVLRAGSVERWTGQLWTGLDREDEHHRLRIRLYHRDWHVDDGLHGDESDASRLGFRAAYDPIHTGFLLEASMERWAASFRQPLENSFPDPTVVGRVRAGWRFDQGTGLSGEFSTALAYAEQADTPWGVCGLAHLQYEGGSKWWVGALSARQLRTPTLFETAGRSSQDMPGGFVLQRSGAGQLPFEIHDRLRGELGREIGRGRFVVGLERWWLHDGIGWTPEQKAAVDGAAFTVGGLEYSIDQLTLATSLQLGSTHHGLMLEANAHAVLGELPLDESRGAGWPKRGAYFTLRWWHDLLSSYDQARILYRVVYAGDHYDDLLAPFTGRNQLVQSSTRQDLRLAVKLRDAELYLEVDNLSDSELVEVTGTRRRGRDFLWGLVWPFWN